MELGECCASTVAYTIEIEYHAIRVVSVVAHSKPYSLLIIYFTKLFQVLKAAQDLPNMRDFHPF